MRTAWLAVLLLIPSALAAQGELDLTASLPVAVNGSHEQIDEGHLLVQGDTGTVGMQFYADHGSVTRVIHRAFGYVRQDDPQAGVLWHQQVHEVELDVQYATLTLQSRLPEFTLLADGEFHRTGVQSQTGILTQPLPIQTSSTGEWAVALQMGQIPEEYTRTLDAGLYQTMSMNGDMHGSTFVGTIGGATLHLETPTRSQELLANFRVEKAPGSVYNPADDTWVGAGDHDEYILEYLKIDATGSFDLHFTNAPARLFAATTTLSVNGETTLPDATGTIRMSNGEIHEIKHESVTIDGAYQFTLAKGNPSHVSGDGDFTKVSYGSVDAQYDWANVAAAVGIGTLVLAGVAWLVAQAKGAVSLAGYARVSGEEILQHPGRQTVYELVKANPGNNFNELSEKVDFGSSTLNYHLRVLEKNDYVTRVKDGRYVRFFDRHNGGYSAGRKTALSTLQNRTTAAIAQHIIQFPGTPQCDLAQRFGIAPSTVSWHIRRLSEAGLVDRARDHHYTRYYMGEAWSSLPSQELQRFGVA